MASLEFSAGALARELEAIKELGGSRFLAPETPGRLDQLKYQLPPLVESKGGKWFIPLDQPLKTRATSSHGGGPELWAELSAKWELKRVGNTQIVRLSGIASVRVGLWREANPTPERVAMWRMEIGDERSPGCYFHTQILGDAPHVPYPNWLSVPRLMGFIPTPAVALEFVLAELFQEEWAEHTSQATRATLNWAGIQRPRLAAMFNWHGRVLGEEGDFAVPWTALKSAKPDIILVKALVG
jgi:hypothetical protein